MSDTPKYLDSSAMELSSWRVLPMTKALIEWLDWEIRRGETASTGRSYDGDHNQATALAGQVQGLRTVLASMHRPIETPDEEIPDDADIDPAKGKR